ncbi:glutamate--cysteine ligase [uncultured Methylovirgula sp.]|uniref:glutamate--cysteine ligase n=1 Tax=uncultured Methylovirgula sp. TaxID=1285960 RepID=UPI002603E199|nr:glutamate--cysteine ligase [uncultured Methylovirgula sp.]
MARDVSDPTPVTSRDELVAWSEAGAKVPAQFRIGTEHEKLPFYQADRRPVPYAGRLEQGGIRALLEGMQEELDWEPIVEAGNIIGLYDSFGGAISLEPGGQFELSGAPLASVHETRAETLRHFAALKTVAAPLDIGFLALGMSPKWTRAETPMMPKQRYAIMARYMPKVGAYGLDMMFRTCTVQTNFDYADEADMVTKLRVSLALQPLITALFANSPFADGKLNGYLSMRSEIWRDTDAARTGMLPFAFEPGMGFERYVDYALDVPMYFVKRGDHYHDVAGASFRDLLAGRLAALPGERATLSDWANHLSTIFPEVRLKRYLEMRGADAGPQSFLHALPALCFGLLYDPVALDGAWQIVKGWDAAARQQLRAETPRLGLGAKIAGRSLRDIANDVLALARQGLAKRARRDADGHDETIYLEPLEAVAAGKSQAEDLIHRFKTRWNGSVDPAFSECAF